MSVAILPAAPLSRPPTATMTHPDSAVRSRLPEQERQRLLASAMHVGMIGMLATTTLGAYWLNRVSDPVTALSWAVLVTLSVMLSGPLAARLLRVRHDAVAAAKVETLYALKMLLTGGLWGALAWWSKASELDLLALGIMQFLILVVSTVVLGFTRWAFPCLLLGIAGPLAARLVATPPAALPPAATAVAIAALVLGVAHYMLFRKLRWLHLRRQQRDALAQEQEAVFHAASEGILLIRDNRVAKCNAQGAAMLGVSPDEIIGLDFGSWLQEPESWPHYLEDMHNAFLSGERFSAVARLRRTDGELFFAELSANPIDPAKLEAGIVLVTTDISIRLATEAALRTSEQRFRRLLSLSSDWYWEQDSRFRFTQIRGTRVDALQEHYRDALGKHRWDLPIEGVDERRWDAHRATLEAHLPFSDFIYQIRTTRGELRWLSINGQPMYDEAGVFCGYHGVGTDITESMRTQERYHHLAHHDTLTGLPNRRLLLDRMDQATAHARRDQHGIALLMMDLDDFKTINDTDGHEAGDQVLIAVAERLRSQIRESDTLCRMGGDEFVILLPEVREPGDAEQVAQKIIHSLSVPFDIGGKNYRVGVSVGIALYPEHTASVDKLLTLADAAMYESKQSGGNNYCFAQLGDQGLLQLESPENTQAASLASGILEVAQPEAFSDAAM
ncbi:diguanylate cyclase domain-containing protein [Viridibacterium curvum]|uniref:diguanylate cyclase domain-containing protein n=1 Tax=Viridibacterium curvum TaxID=1101404 RepID=UPI0031EF3E29